MRFLSVHALALGAAFALTACNEPIQKELTRTSATKLNNRVEVTFPLGHTECETKVEKVCHDWTEECENVCVQGNCERQCKTIPPGCEYHERESCHFVKERDFRAFAVLAFDPRAKLKDGQQEKYSFRGRYNSKTGKADVKVSVQSRYYDYKFPQNVSLTEGKTTTVKFTATRVK